MKLSRKKLLKGCIYKKEIDQLLTIVERVFITWESFWTPFIPAPVRDEAIKIFEGIADINFYSNGGYPNAERQRILIKRDSIEDILDLKQLPIGAIKIEGNFLFDKTSPEDFQNALLKVLGIEYGSIGDIWITGDRGAQAICTSEALQSLYNCKGFIRDVEVTFKALDLSELRLPSYSNTRKIISVEASKRLDAIASAGFGFSRARIVKQIKEGKIRLNWQPINSVSRPISIGDRIQMEGRGSIEILDLNLTKKERWRVELIKK
ncbi:MULTISPECIES: photosystem II S4 domain protein [unclassified Prochlorococcus]|uniref:photosystem II S4 domain protein n=1 Tax=unclassified Prochlorococcus TaxID=2627481 RepID=UPI0005337B3F|nr:MULTISPECIES: photosystem II S4 domain protein [unclassified Prochlorococcus]KGG16198.1 hypothetical protein EV07_1365 [Prochlorococcus sp. MIT 0603]KGG18067.1 hypothetical protein EV06_0195 [Prochlorococcus sp. MIT 0602]